MSGFHWSDDPVAASRDNARRVVRELAKSLEFDLTYTSTIRSDCVATCQKCGALIWIGNDEFLGAGGYLERHRNWHGNPADDVARETA